MTGAPGGWAIRRLLPAAQKLVAASGSPATFMLRWARELVVDRTVLVYSPALRERIGPSLGPVRLFADQSMMWRAAATALGKRRNDAVPVRLRVFPQGGLTYVTGTPSRDQ
jgi:lactate racemase